MMMKKILLLGVLGLIWLCGCEKPVDKVHVRYEVTDASAPVQITYRPETGPVVDVTHEFASAEDTWTVGFDAEPGDIVYLSGVYYDTTASVSLRILLDGKVFKQGSSNQEPQKFVTISGTVPY